MDPRQPEDDSEWTHDPAPEEESDTPEDPDISLVLGDTYIMDISKKEDHEIFMGTITDFDPQEHIVSFVGKEDRLLQFEYTYTDDTYLLTRHNDIYTINELYRVTSFDPDKEDYRVTEQDLQIDMYITDDLVYSDYLQSDDILSSLIQSMNVYKYPRLIKKLQETVDILLSLSKSPDTPYQDTLLCGTTLSDCPSYIYPVTYSSAIRVDHDSIKPELLEEQQGSYVDQVRTGANHLISLQGSHSYPYGGRYLYDEGTLKDKRGYHGISMITLANESDQSEQLSVTSDELIPIRGALLDPLQSCLSQLPRESLRQRISAAECFSKTQRQRCVKDISITEESLDTQETSTSDLDDYILFETEDTLSESEFMSRLSHKLPTKTHIADAVYDDIYSEYVMNLGDIQLLLDKYHLTYKDLSVTSRQHLMTLCKPRTPLKIHKSKTKSPPELSIASKIKGAHAYILSLTDISVQRPLLQQFIDTYTRRSDKTHEDPLWLYNKYTNHKLLCTHYCYLAKSTNDNDSYETMISSYAIPGEEDGLICKVCGTYLEGYQSEDPDSMNRHIPKEELRTQQIEEYLADNSTEVAIVRSIGNALEVDIPDELLYDVLQTCIYMNHDELADIRYEMTGVSRTSNHPRVSKMIDDNKRDEAQALKQAKKGEVKGLKKKFQEERSQIIHMFQRWLKHTNTGLLLLSLFILYIQTSVPSMSLKKPYLLRLINPKTREIQPRSLRYLLTAFRHLSTSLQNDPFWRECLELFQESESVSAETQLIHTLTYATSPTFPPILQRFTLYEEYISSSSHEFLLPEWVMFKPLSENKLMSDLSEYIENTLVLQDLLKTYSGYPIENMSLVRVSHTEDMTLADRCGIPQLHILRNEAFKKLLRFTISCYGVHKNNPWISLLINQLLETIDKPGEIQHILQDYGWNSHTKGFPSLDFHAFRNHIIPRILSLYSREDGSYKLRTCYGNEESCNTLIHTHVNTYDIHMLVTFPKRVYSYTPPCVYPTETLKDLQSTRPEWTKHLFDAFRYDVNHEFVSSVSHEMFTYGLTVDDPLPTCTTHALKVNQETYQELLQYIRTRGSLPYYPIMKPHITYKKEDYEALHPLLHNESDLLRWLQSYPTERNMYQGFHTELQEFWEDYLRELQAPPQDHTKEYMTRAQSKCKILFSTIMSQQQMVIKRVATCMGQDVLSGQYKQRFISVFRSVQDKSFTLTKDKIEQVFTHFLRDPALTFDTMYMYIQDIRRILLQLTIPPQSRSSQLNVKGEFLYKRWKISGTCETTFPKFLVRDTIENHVDTYNLLLHENVFAMALRMTGKRKNYYSGFQSYEREIPQTPLYISSLLAYLQPYLDNCEYLRGCHGALYSDKYSRIYMKYHLSLILSKIVDFIDGLQDESSDISTDANELFISLDQAEQVSIEECTQVCTRFLFDITTHVFQTHYDPLWFTQNQYRYELQTRLSKSKEQEKQTLIGKMDSASKEQRFIMVQKQQAGISNWFQDGADAKQALVQSDDYLTATTEERHKMFQDLHEDIVFETEALLEVMDVHNPPTNPVADAHLPDTNTDDPLSEEEDSDNDDY